MTRSPLDPALLLILLLTWSAAAGSAQAPDLDRLRNAVAVVIAKGVLTRLGNAPVVAQATGFFTSKQGFLVTSYHLRAELGDVDERTVTYEVRFGPTSADIYAAAPIHINQAADFMVLYVSVGDRNIETFTLGTRVGVRPGITPIYTVGYPAGYHYSVDIGVVRSFGLTEAIPAWSTNMTFKSGQSGSPIFLENFRVIAIAKGNDAASTSIGLMVPSQMIPTNYWDSSFTPAPNAAKFLSAGDSSSLPRIAVQVALDEQAPVTRTATFSLRNELCDTSTSKSHRIAATPGWVIDPASINVEMLSFTGASSRYAVTERDPQGFTVSAEMNNIGKCLKIFGETIPSGVAAQFTGRVTYSEKPQAPALQYQTVSDTTAIGNVLTPLPNVPRDKLKFSLISPSGDVQAFEPTVAELKTRDGVLLLDTGRVQERIRH